MGDFNFQQYVAPVQDVDGNAAGGAGGAGGHSGSLAFGYADADADGGKADGGNAAGGDGGNGAGGDGGNSAAL
ncbi:MAG: hypothetical protein ACRDTB_31155, partial [Actinophytocola sp.]